MPPKEAPNADALAAKASALKKTTTVVKDAKPTKYDIANEKAGK